MLHRMILAFMFLIVSLFLPSAPAKTYSAEQFDQAITVQQDGSMLVKETIIFTFHGGPFTYVYRDLPTDKTDGITVLSTMMDERIMPQGKGSGQVEITNENPIKVTWHFAPISDQTHTFVLTYRVLGVVQKDTDADLLNWEILPTDYDYSIHSSITTISYPALAILTAAPQVVRGVAQVTVSPGKTIFTAHNISAGSHLEIALKFRSGSIIVTAPHWQQLQERARALLLPYLVDGLVIFFLVLLLALWHYRHYRPPSVMGQTSLAGYTTPPNELPPAIVGAVIAPTDPMHWNSALATIFDLARRKVLVISQAPGAKKWYQMHPDFQIEQCSRPTDLCAYELDLLAVLFQDKEAMSPSISLSNLSRKYTNRCRRFTRSLKQDLIERGLLDEARQRVRAWSLGISMSVAIAAFIATVVAVSAAGTVGMWPLAFLPLGVCLASSMMSALWAVFSPLTDQGRQEVENWRAFSHYLTDIVRGREPVLSPELFGQYLVYATSLGLVEKWVQYFQQRGMIEIPSWFHSLATARSEDISYFVSMIAVSHVAGHASSSGGDGGAAGGGASGAG